MGKERKKKIEYRYYQMKPETYVFALLGDDWIREYGKNIDYLHFHNFMEIGYCLNGGGEMIYGDETFPYKKGTFTIIPKNYPHTTNSIPGHKCHWEYLFIDEESFLKKFYGKKSSKKKVEKAEENLNARTLLFEEKDYPGIANNILELMDILRKKDYYYEEESQAVLASLLIKIAKLNENCDEKRNVVEEELYVTESNSDIVRQATEYIDLNYMEDIYIEDLAKICSISETQLRRLFLQNMKVNIHEYINLIRIQKACEMLRCTDISVSDIADKCGFSTVSTFNRNFKKIVGDNPCKWRKNPENYEQTLLKYNIHMENGW